DSEVRKNWSSKVTIKIPMVFYTFFFVYDL
ncbi:uncharacterized protein METZ01_LOCUS505217, partial [marine metagenome]